MLTVSAIGNQDFFVAKPGDEGRSPQWGVVRAAWIKDHSVCRACGGTKQLQVHHKKPFHLFPELELDPTNFITLCEAPLRDCHYSFGHGYDWHGYNPNVETDADWFLKIVQESKILATK